MPSTTVEFTNDTADDLRRRLQIAEQRLRLYEAALSNTPDLVYVFDRNHRFTYANEGLLTMWGRTWDEAIGRNCLELGYEPWHAAMHDREIEEVIATRRPIKGEVPFTGTFGRRIYEYIFVPVVGPGGEVEAVAGTTRDVTDRGRAEEELRHSEERYRTLMEQSPFSIQVFSPDGRTIRVNRAWEELWGVSFDALANYNILEDRQLEAKGVASCIRAGFAGRATRIPTILYNPNETIPNIIQEGDPRRWLSAVIYPLKDGNGVIRELVLIHQDVTAEYLAEENRRLSDQRTRMILESITDSFFAVDRDWRFTYVNPQGERILNRVPGDLLGQVIWDVYPGLLGTEFERAYRRVAEERVTESVTAYYADHHRWYEVHVYPASDGISIYFRDATERKLAEAELARLTQAADQQRRIYETALSNSADFNYVFDLQGRFVFVNKALLDLWGKSLHEAVGKNFFELDYPAPLAERLQMQIQTVIRTRQPLRDETPYTSANGEAQYEYIFVPVVAADGTVEAVAGSTRNITDRKRTEVQLRESVRLYRAIGESIDYGVWLCDAQGRNLYASDSFLKLVGMTQEEYSEFGWERALHPDDAERTLTAWTECVRTGGQWDVENRFRGADGQWHPVLARGIPVRNEDGEITAWAGINLDISRIKHVEDELRLADRRKDEFLATLAHELRNPLAPINNSLQILKMPRVDPTTAQRTREMMERQVHHLVRLVDDLLDVSRVMRGKIELRREPIELATVIARAVETVKPLIEMQGHQLEISLPPRSLLLDADPVRMSQVISNLLTNSAKYTDPPGQIWVAAWEEDSLAVLSIRDNGIGISSEMLPHVFELFVQADHSTTKAQGGLGIGLTLVKNLVEMHGGSVEARSPGLKEGSEFLIRIPLLPAIFDSRFDISEDQRPITLPSGHRLLVVDDNRDAAISLEMLLQLQGHEVRVAHDGENALRLAVLFRPSVIFLDIGMPGMDGYEVARRLRTIPELEGTVLAALTGWGQQEDRRRTAEAGFDYHIVKPPDPEALEQILGGLNLAPETNNAPA